MADYNEKTIEQLDKNEIADLAMWTAHSITDAFKENGVKISAIDENFIAQLVNVLIKDWQKGIVIDATQVIRRAFDFDDFKNNKVSTAAFKVLAIFAEKFPQFVSLNSPAVKV